MHPTADRQDPAELIPWYINGTLTPEESAMVEAYLAQGGEEAAAELRLQQLMQAHEKAHQPGSTPGEFGWKRLQRDVHRIAQKQQTANKPMAWLRPAMAAAVAVIVIQAALLGSLWLPDQESGLQPLSGRVTPSADLQIKFQPQATELQIRTLLNQVDARLVDGPSAAGIYRLSLANNSAANQRAVSDQLQAAADVIEHVAAE